MSHLNLVRRQYVGFFEQLLGFLPRPMFGNLDSTLSLSLFRLWLRPRLVLCSLSTFFRFSLSLDTRFSLRFRFLALLLLFIFRVLFLLICVRAFLRFVIDMVRNFKIRCWSRLILYHFLWLGFLFSRSRFLCSSICRIS